MIEYKGYEIEPQDMGMGFIFFNIKKDNKYINTGLQSIRACKLYITKISK